MTILVRPDGKMYEIETQVQVDDCLKSGWKLANENQVKSFMKENYSGETPDTNNVYFYSPLGSADGYGMSAEALREEMMKIDIMLGTSNKGQKVGLLYNYPSYLDKLNTQVKLIYTMFESSKISSSWVPFLKQAKVLVPSHFCQQAFATRDIETEVIPLGYNQNSFFPDTSVKKNEVFTFLHYNAFDNRKGWDLLFEAFTQEFKNDRQVKLVFKTIKETLPFPILKSQYPNIDVIKGRLGLADLRKLISQSDCFVFPSRGEGFGLTPLEGLACGIPAIIPNGSGMSEYFNENFFIGVDYHSTPAFYDNKLFTPDEVGDMIECDIDSLRAKLRWAFNNRDKVKEMGIKGAEWVSKKYTIKKTAERLKQELQVYL